MESSDLKADLIKQVNHIIYQQSLIKRDENEENENLDEENIKALQALKDADFPYLSLNDKQIFNITIGEIIKYYQDDKIHNPKLLSEKFFDNVRAQKIENELEKDVRSDGTINPDLEKIIEKAGEQVDEGDSKELDDKTGKKLDEIVSKMKDEKAYDANSDIESLLAKKTIQKANEILPSGVDISLKEKADSDDSSNRSLNISVDGASVSINRDNDSSNITSDTTTMDNAIQQLKIAHLKTVESLSNECKKSSEEKDQKLKDNKEPLKCDNDEDTLKIKKEVVDEFGLFLNGLFDDEMSKIEEWEDKELAKKFKNFYQAYNLKIVDHLIEKYNMEN